MESTHPSAPSECSNAEITADFVRGRAGRSSPELSVAHDVLLAGGRVTIGLRAGDAAVFVRSDLPAELADLRLLLEQALDTDGLTVLDRDSGLAEPVARERLGAGAEGARWDLWGRSLAEVFAALTTGGRPEASERRDVVLPPVDAAGPDADTSAAEAPAAPLDAGRPDDVTSTKDGAGPMRPRALVAGLVVLGLLAAGGIYAQRQRSNAGKTAGAKASAAPTAKLVDYRDPRGRFTLQYPDTWRPAQTANTAVALLLLGPGGGSMLVRIVPLAKAVDPTNIADVKAVTDAIVQAPTVRIVQQKPVTLSGSQGYFYLYTFTDTASGQEGVHSHFFLFRGRTMHTFVFQALPSGSFGAAAADFDRIAQSYRPLA